MKHITLWLFAAPLACYASEPALVKIADNRYQVRSEATAAQGGMQHALDLAISKANQTCEALGGAADLGSLHSQDLGPASSFANFQFYCFYPLRSDALENVKKAAQKLAQALSTLDSVEVVALTSPKLFTGGVTTEMAVGVFERQYNMLRQRQVTLAAEVLELSPEFKRDETTYYLFVPVMMKFDGPNTQSRQTRASFLALSEDLGLTWTFVDTQQMKPSVIKRYVPSYQEPLGR